jgi:hypothetical protein
MPPAWDRYARWGTSQARLMLALVAGLLLLAIVTPLTAGEGEVRSGAISQVVNPAGQASSARARDEDLALYDDVIARLRKGEHYYTIIAEEHRRHRFPLHPGFAVRLPTLAVTEAILPPGAMIPLSLALMGGVLLAWWRRLAAEPGGTDLRLVAMAALCFGVSIGTTRYFFVLHELWAGQLLALSLGLHRPGQKSGVEGRWLGAWLAAAAALAIREHALPFVLLMAAFALWHRRWREGAAWIALVLAFVAAMALHLHVVAGMVQPADPASASWITLRGLGGWLSMVVLSSNLRWLPPMLSAPLVLLAMFGWSGWRSALGVFATLLFLGYGVGFMIAGRPDNFYWGMMVAPAMLTGLAMVPTAMHGLVRSAFPVQRLVPA